MKQVPSALQAQSGARGPSRVTTKPCEPCGHDTLHIGNVCNDCKRGGVPTGALWSEGHSIRGRRK
jgi:hypothetical protein